jgi:hypothetical protein
VTDIIAHLRQDRPLSWEDRLEAADEITRLREENARLREALTPFARAAEYCEGLGDLDHKSVLVGNFRAAAAAILEAVKAEAACPELDEAP